MPSVAACGWSARTRWRRVCRGMDGARMPEIRRVSGASVHCGAFPKPDHMIVTGVASMVVLWSYLKMVCAVPLVRVT